MHEGNLVASISALPEYLQQRLRAELKPENVRHVERLIETPHSVSVECHE